MTCGDIATVLITGLTGGLYSRNLSRARVHPVLVGGGIPFFPQRERKVDFELVESRTFS
jgi:hypothetical protein